MSIPMYLHKYAKDILPHSDAVPHTYPLQNTHFSIFLHLIYNPRLPSCWTILHINKYMPLHSLTPTLTMRIEIQLLTHLFPGIQPLFLLCCIPRSFMEILFLVPIHIQSQAQTVPANIYIHPTLKAYSRQQKVGEKFLAQVL